MSSLTLVVREAKQTTWQEYCKANLDFTKGGWIKFKITITVEEPWNCQLRELRNVFRSPWCAPVRLWWAIIIPNPGWGSPAKASLFCRHLPGLRKLTEHWGENMAERRKWIKSRWKSFWPSVIRELGCDCSNKRSQTVGVWAFRYKQGVQLRDITESPGSFWEEGGVFCH